MKYLFFVSAALALLTSASYCQHGTAPMGYYPLGYNGDTWTGEVTAVNKATREITLAHKDEKHGKTEIFTGAVQEGYKVNTVGRGEHELDVSEIPLGTKLIVYYIPRMKKVEGKKAKYYEIFRLNTAPTENK